MSHLGKELSFLCSSRGCAITTLQVKIFGNFISYSFLNIFHMGTLEF